jgi:hypothetical protein
MPFDANETSFTSATAESVEEISVQAQESVSSEASPVQDRVGFLNQAPAAFPGDDSSFPGELFVADTPFDCGNDGDDADWLTPGS